MEYHDLNDFELVSYIKENNEEATQIMYKKYKPLIIKIAKRMYTSCQNSGLELNDLIQEGMLALSQALTGFDDSKDITFFTYAKTCIERKMISTVLASTRLKHRILNESIPLDIYNDDDELVNFDALLKDDSYNPEIIVSDNDELKLMVEKVKEVLTPYENQVFELKISNFNYQEIAKILDKKPKDIDNALQRIKIKIKDLRSNKDENN